MTATAPPSSTPAADPTVELGMRGHLDALDGILFPSICDVIRNLSGVLTTASRSSSSSRRIGMRSVSSSPAAGSLASKSVMAFTSKPGCRPSVAKASV